MDYYKMYSNIIEILDDKNQYKELLSPKSNSKPYSDIGKMCGKLEFVKFIGASTDNEQLIEYKNDASFKIIMKRKTISCNLNYNQILNDPEKRNFINEVIKEFCIARKMLSHDTGVFPFDLKITFLESCQLLVSELLMEKGGELLINLLDKSNYSIDFLKTFKQLTSFLEFIQNIQINFSNLTFENFLIDEKGNLKIINYGLSNICKSLSYCLRDKFQDEYRIIHGYIAPELYHQFKQSKTNLLKSITKEISTEKVMVYLCGILGLMFAGAFTTSELSKLNDFDKFKSNEKDHLNIIKKTKNIKIQNLELNEKIQCLLERCLCFDPKVRLTLSQLNIILGKLENGKYNLANMKNDIGELKYQQNNQESQTIDQIKDENKKLSSKIQELSLKLSNQGSSVSQAMNPSFTHNSGNQESDLLKKFEEIFIKTKYKNSIKLTSINDILNFVQQIIEDINNLIDKNQKLLDENKNLLLNKKAVTQITEEEKARPPSSSSSSFLATFPQVQPLDLNAINSTNLRKDIKMEISKKDFWNFYQKNINKQDILTVLELGAKSSTIKGINFGENELFDDECGKAYANLVQNNNSIQGICLFKLKISSEQIINIIENMYIKQKIKFFLVSKDSLSENTINQIANKLKWKINNWESKYFDFLDYYYFHNSYHQSYNYSSFCPLNPHVWFVASPN